MVEYIFCKKCGKVIDEFEKACYWCVTSKEIEKNEKSEKMKSEKNEKKINKMYFLKINNF